MTADAVTQIAHAKINLCLHVTGQRGGGYHLLDSMVIFTEIGDVITVAPADELHLTINGPFAAGLDAGNDNLVMRAARLMAGARGAGITLTKNLPLASGIGGGSADAAATLFALSDLWHMPLPDWDAITALGADVPVCMSTELTRMRGIGEVLDRIGPVPRLPMLLVNPRVAVPTPAVFKALPQKDNPALPDDMPNAYDTPDWLDWLGAQRNDLEAAAITLRPEIAGVLAALRAQNGARLARMSGSGATCFAFFDSVAQRDAAADVIAAGYPDWWVAPTLSLE